MFHPLLLLHRSLRGPGKPGSLDNHILKTAVLEILIGQVSKMKMRANTEKKKKKNIFICPQIKSTFSKVI